MDYLSVERWKKSTKLVLIPVKNLLSVLFLFLYFSSWTIHGFNVDIEKPLIFNGTQKGSYFGYSVILVKNSVGTRIFIAAPKFVAYGALPGMLYECGIREDSVKKHLMCDTQVRVSDDDAINMQTYNSQQWLGVAMDVSENKSKIIVCAHRWCEIVSRQFRMIGACYISPTTKTEFKFWAPNLPSHKKNGVFYQGMAQFGTSAQFSKNDKDILFGAPGIYQGKGGFVIKDIGSDKFKIVDYSDKTHHKIYSQEGYEDSMVGYSITSGRFFFKDIQIAVGGPGPSTFGLGKVLIYSGEMLIGRYSGSQYGGGFGSSLASGDFSGDGNDDLVVGAPMEYDKVNEGRVYILISTGSGSFLENEIVLVGDNIPGAHFGTTVANIGDLNLDGLDDLAVGAPFEDDCGAIYIYYGSLISMDESRRQKILGKTLSPGLKGFGISFSRPNDIDDNGYVDFAVGAFLSDQAVLLHTRPVIKTNTTVQSSPPELNPQNTNCFGDVFKTGCLNLSVGINLVGNAFKNVDLEVYIFIDSEKNENEKRAVLQEPEDKSIQMELSLSNQFRKTYQLKTRKTKDLFNPVVVNIKFIVKSNSTEKNISPVQDLMKPNTLKYEIPFQNDCGPDKLCAVDLQTRLKWLGKERNSVLLIGGERQFRIGITIANGAEPAYQPLGTFGYPDYINYVSFNKFENSKILGCQLVTMANLSQAENWNNVICTFNNPLRKGQIYYELSFDIPQMVQTVGEFEMKFSVTSESYEMYPDSNNAVLNVKMRKKSVLSVNTVSDPQYILVSPKAEKSSSNVKSISHQYSFYNNGPSDLKRGNFTLRVSKVQSLLDDLIHQVNATGSFPIIYCLSKKFQEKLDFYEVNCYFKEWVKESMFSVEIFLQIDVANLDSALPDVKSELHMKSVKDSDYVDGIAIEEKIYSVITNLRSPGKPKPVKTWIIVVCIILGILLLLGLIAGLWKFSCLELTPKQSEVSVVKTNFPLYLLMSKKNPARCKPCGFFKRQKVHRVRQHDGSMKQEVQPDPDSEPLTN